MEANIQQKKRLNSLIQKHLESSTPSNVVAPEILMELCDLIRLGLGNDFLLSIKDPFKKGTPQIQLRSIGLLDSVVTSTPPTFLMLIATEEWTERLFRTTKTTESVEVRDKIMAMVLQWTLRFPSGQLNSLLERYRNSKVVGEAYQAVYNEVMMKRATDASLRQADRSRQQQQPPSAVVYAEPVATPSAAPRAGITNHRPRQQQQRQYADPNETPPLAALRQQSSREFSMTNIENFLMDTQNDISLLEYGLEHPDMLEGSALDECVRHRAQAIHFVSLENLPDTAREQLILVLEQLTQLLSFHDTLFGTSYIPKDEIQAAMPNRAVTPPYRDDDDVVPVSNSSSPAAAAPSPTSLFDQLPSTAGAQSRSQGPPIVAAPVAMLQRQSTNTGFSTAERDRLLAEAEALRKEIQSIRSERDAAVQAKEDAQAKYKDAKTKNKLAVEQVERLMELEDQSKARIAQLEDAAAKHRAAPPPPPVIKEVIKTVKPQVDHKYISQVRNQLRAVRREAQSLKDIAIRLRSESTSMASEVSPKVMQIIASANSEGAKQQKTIKWLEELYKKETRLRKMYYNQIQDLKGNIRVYCRVRPISQDEVSGGHSDITSYPVDDEVRIVDQHGKVKSFEFDAVFKPTSTQAQVFEDTSPLIDSVIDGYNVCIFAYGQTGSGKTHTMAGPDSNPGINKRAITRLFQIIEERKDTETSTVTVSILEIYNETIRDLLVSKAEAARNTYDVKTGGPFGNYVTNLIEEKVTEPTQIETIMKKANSHRAEASTNMNQHSSRSHMVVYIVVKTVNNTTGAQSFGKLSLIDLAGSERLDKSGAEGQAAKEAVAINKSLTSLGDTISALSTGAKHVPYRNSLLTYLLQDSMSGQAKVLMFCCASPASYNAPETLSSLGFATRARGVSLGQVKKNVVEK